jgi:hypothetical protein
MAATATSVFGNFPSELVRDILEGAVRSSLNEDIAWVADLQRVSSVARHWIAPILYNTLYIRTSSDHYPLTTPSLELFASIRFNPDALVRQYVRHVVFTGRTPHQIRDLCFVEGTHEAPTQELAERMGLPWEVESLAMPVCPLNTVVVLGRVLRPRTTSWFTPLNLGSSAIAIFLYSFLYAVQPGRSSVMYGSVVPRQHRALIERMLCDIFTRPLASRYSECLAVLRVPIRGDGVPTLYLRVVLEDERDVADAHTVVVLLARLMQVNSLENKSAQRRVVLQRLVLRGADQQYIDRSAMLYEQLINALREDSQLAGALASFVLVVPSGALAPADELEYLCNLRAGVDVWPPGVPLQPRIL